MKVTMILCGILGVCILSFMIIVKTPVTYQYILYCTGGTDGYVQNGDSWACITSPFQKEGKKVIDTYRYDGSLKQLNFIETDK